MQTKKMADYVNRFNQNDEETIHQDINNAMALDWIQAHVPYFECPDKTIEETYYFRWWVFRKHIKKTPEGMVITEFLPDVPWAGPYNTINSAVGHHIAEARWLRHGQRIVDDYIRFWFQGSGDVYAYSSWIVAAIYEYCLVQNNFDTGIGLLPDFEKYYAHIENNNMTKCGLFWSNDDRDAMEMSISGSGLRPTLNTYMYANAVAIARFATIAGAWETAQKYENKAAALKVKINALLWDNSCDFYKVIPMCDKDSAACAVQIPAKHEVLEAIGYIPWSFNLTDGKSDRAWRYLTDAQIFAGKYGLLTAQREHPKALMPCNNHECLWNGPTWPFATTQTVSGMIHTLKNGETTHLTKADFMNQMSLYAACHFRQKEDGTRVNWLDENIDPDTGEWLSRRILKDWGWPAHKAGYERGKDYNHSAFCDLVIRGICGIDLTDGDNIRVNPLLPDGLWDYFLLDGLHYKNHVLTVIYDATGLRYQKGKGMMVFVDGKLAGQSDGLNMVII